MRRLASIVLSLPSLFACTTSERGDVSILARPVSAANGSMSPPRRTFCERLPTDLAAAKPPYPNSVTWSADGAFVAAAIGQSGESSSQVDGADGIVVWSASTGEVTKRWRVQAHDVAFAHSGDRLAFASLWGDGVIDPKTDCVERWSRRSLLVKWSADDRSLFLAGFHGLASVDATDGALLHERPQRDQRPRIVAMDTSSTSLATGDELDDVRTFSLDLSRIDELATQGNDLGNGRAIAITPDGSLVASARVESIPVHYPPNTMPGSPFRHRSFVRLVSVADRSVRSDFPSDVDALAFSPDGASLAIAGESRLVVRNVATGETRVLDEKVSFPRRVAWSPDGRSLALAEWRGAVRIYDARSGAPPRLFVP